MRALESLLLEKGLLAPDAVDRVIRRYEASTGPMVGARAVARAWRDPGVQAPACSTTRRPRSADFGVDYDRLVVVENTPARHNLVVCTLCSCYPWDVMGLPPTWYKMPAYRSRAVSEPRAVLARVRLGSRRPSARSASGTARAELRYMVLPMRAGRRRRGWARTELAPADHARGADRRGRGARCRDRARAERDPVYERRRNIVVRPDGRPVNVARFRGPALRVRHRLLLRAHRDGFAAVPAELYHGEWERRRLRNVVHLTIGGCLGPCALANVVLLLFDGQAQWFHSIDSEALVLALYDHVEAHAGGRRAACLRRPRSRRTTSRRSAWQPRPDGQPVDDRPRPGGPPAGARAPAHRLGRRRRRRPAARRVDRRGRGDSAGPGRAVPRQNGELVFDEPWQGRVFGMAVALYEQGGLDWEEFRQALIAQIAAAEARGGDVPLLRDLARRLRGVLAAQRPRHRPRSSRRPPTSSSSASATTSSRAAAGALSGRRCGGGRARARRRAGRARA